MKKILIVAILVAVAALAGLWPFQGVDAADVVPVETVAIGRNGSTVQVLAGEDLSGQGDSLEEALEDLEASAPGTVFFGTVERVILTQNAMDLVGELMARTQFRPSVLIYATSGAVEPAEAQVLEAYESRGDYSVSLCRVYAATLGGEACRVAKVEIEDGSWQFANA